MRPTLQARGLKESLLQYLSTTYALSDEGARESLHRFLGDETTGMFRGPFHRVRTPFRTADESWRASLEWVREGWTPYAHQAAAFARLSSARGHEPLPTLVTTGTGSGKTESFLYPILDHCAREHAAGHRGIKAVLLYPMNALATDQAFRLNNLLADHPTLQRLRGGLYIGDKPDTEYGRVFTLRSEMRATPPDILITNYKMLDLLLQRDDDRMLWDDADIRYVVVDEFHSYDGAQATDVAMLLRRLSSAVGAAEPGRPLGRICPVATSATLGTDQGGERDLLDVAAQVFGTEFTPDAVIGENRRGIDEFIDPADFDPELPLPTPEEIAALPDPGRDPAAILALAEVVTGVADADPHRLGRVLKRHPLTAAVLKAVDGRVRTSAEILDLMWRHGAWSWGQTIARQPETAALALARVLALMSTARDPESGVEHPRPFVHVEVHQWARSVTRVLRGVQQWPRADFRWDAVGTAHIGSTTRTAPLTVATGGQAANLFLPAVYCRDCGRSGWAVFSPEAEEYEVQFDPHKIRRASTSQDKFRVRNLIAATDQEAREGSGTASMVVSRQGLTGETGGTLMVLDGPAGRLRLPDPARDYVGGQPRLSGTDSAFVLVVVGDNAGTAAKGDWCPSCGERNAIRYLGTGAAAIAAAAITQLFTGGELDEAIGEDKTLMFNDSVQDAAHRAGFVASRSYTFSLRALLKKHLAEDRPTALNDLIADVVERTTDRKTLRAVVPADLHDMRGVSRLLSGTGWGGDLATWRLIGERLAFDTLMEFGFRSRNGRTLELTRTAAASVRIADPVAAVKLVRAAHLDGDRAEPVVEQDDERYLAFLRVFLERLRTRGAVGHRWLTNYVRESGTNRYQIWGGRPQGMRAFPGRVAAPRFLLSAPKARSDFDAATGRLTWYELWARRCLELTRTRAPEFWSRLLPALVAEGVLAVTTPADSSLRAYGLRPGHIDVRLLTDDEVGSAFVRCPVCSWEQTVHPLLSAQWHGQPCPSYRCRRGRLISGDHPEALGIHQRDRDYRDDYYRRLYRRAGTYQVITAEHTGMLTRSKREAVEKAFREGIAFDAPNVLACTPTLEMGIDIGDLSAVVLAALPRGAANYAQQVGRAGRRTGNAFLLTIPDRRRRDLYFVDQPREMIDGTIVPPGAYLSAYEILRRQYLAHLLDLAARGRLSTSDSRPLRAVPSKAPLLFGPSGYLADLVELALERAETLLGGFLALFPTGVNKQAEADLRRYATRGLRGAVEEAERDWRLVEEMLRSRLRLIDEAIGELHDSDPDEARQKAELLAERKGVGARLAEHGQTDAQQALCALGLLPNYALIDTVTTLNATLYWSDGIDPRTNRPRYSSRLMTYDRPRRYALQELAPGNTFYVNGYKHEITGLEIGTAAQPLWRRWRFCQQCGFVRTQNAVTDRSACDRCGSTGLADDGSSLFQVMEPTVVTSRSKREDARISDDSDDRERRFYTVIDAVDMPAEALEPKTSWRHRTRTFGVDFCRSTMIRRINVGLTHFDRAQQDRLAGHETRVVPFHVCTGCGAATADGQPVFNHDSDAVSGSGVRDPRVRHHQPWCPVRRGRPKSVTQEPVLLAHQLRTEALRILLPTSTTLVSDRVHSFRAALRLGVDRYFGGDPQHLDTTLASMPDSGTGQTRHFLVLFDRLPGGTGYLHRLTKPHDFRDLLTKARAALRDCPCAQEGRPACHRCLHRYTEERFQDLVSRQEAQEILNDLLGKVDEHGVPITDDWVVDPVTSTEAIGLDRQVESDLEARFLAALRRWVRLDEHASLDEEGRTSGYLRFADTADVVSWRLTAQQRLDRTRTDFTFSRVDGPPRSVVVYLDGHRWHATREHNRIAEDAARRTELRDEGTVVFQITWDDIDLFEEVQTNADPVWPPYTGHGREMAGNICEHLGGSRGELADTVFTNPITSLLAYLRHPEPEDWTRWATALVAGLTITGEKIAVTDRVGARRTLRALLTNTPAPTVKPGPVTVLRSSDTRGLTVFVALDATRPDSPRWSVVSVLDDSPTALDAGQRSGWRSWLYWSNLTQFLTLADGDGVQLAASAAALYPVETLAVCSAASSVIETELAVEILRDSGWIEILEILREDEPGSPLTTLAERLVAAGKTAPVFGYELGERRWLAEFAWPDVKIAIVGPDQETGARDAAFLAAGWRTLTTGSCLDDLDSLLTRLPDVEGSAAR